MRVLFLVSCVLVCCERFVVFGNQDDFEQIDSLHPEQLCNREGGMCVIAADCPTGHLTPNSGLCPEQQHKGVECCYGRSVKDTRCSNMGVCRPESEKCPPSLVIPATDCPANTRCCVLVK